MYLYSTSALVMDDNSASVRHPGAMGGGRREEEHNDLGGDQVRRFEECDGGGVGALKMSTFFLTSSR